MAMNKKNRASPRSKPAAGSKRRKVLHYDTKIAEQDCGRLVPVYKQRRRKRKRGSPLLVYPAEQSPMFTGLVTYH